MFCYNINIYESPKNLVMIGGATDVDGDNHATYHCSRETFFIIAMHINKFTIHLNHSNQNSKFRKNNEIVINSSRYYVHDLLDNYQRDIFLREGVSKL